MDLIKKLLEKDRTLRLGSKGGVNEILAHPWFKGVDRVKLEKYQVVPPFKPVTEEGNLTQFFNSKDNAQAMTDTVLPAQSLRAIKQNQNQFSGFSSSSAKSTKK